MRTYAHIFYVDSFDSMPDQPQGWYYAFGCDPACLPESDPVGPFGDERLAEAEARAEMMEQGYEELDHLTWEVENKEPEMFTEEDTKCPCGCDGPNGEACLPPLTDEVLFDPNRLDCQPEAFDPSIYGGF